MTVGQLKAIIANMPDDYRVGTDDTGSEYDDAGDRPVWGAWEQASDVVQPPLGTDPMYEGTTGVLFLVMDKTTAEMYQEKQWLL